MQLITQRFGTVEFDAREVLIFEDGLLGDRRNRQWLLFADSRHELLYWLQCISDSRIALPVVDADTIDGSYQVELPPVDSTKPGSGEEGPVMILAPISYGPVAVSIDLRRPIVVSTGSQRGRQLWNEQYQPQRWMSAETSSSQRKCA